MCLTLNRLFFALFPTTKKIAQTEEGHWLRRMLFIAAFCHFGLSIWALAIIGFWPMFFNLLQLTSSYSCYLTLRERQIWIYMIILVMQVIYLVCCLVGLDDHGARETSTM